MTEEQLHKKICVYIKKTYPKVIFSTDMSGIKLSRGQANKSNYLRSGNGFPDLTIFEKNKTHNALFIEIKKETPYKANGDLKKSSHLENQDRMHKRLRMRNFDAGFYWSFEMAKLKIDNYLKVINKSV